MKMCIYGISISCGEAFSGLVEFQTVFENTDTDLREHGQFFGKVHNSCDGRGDDLGELTEGLQVDFVVV